jgi:uncharacterized membrane protein YGL010W
MVSKVKAFLENYLKRHKHPANALLHLAGVPLVFWGLITIFSQNQVKEGLLCIILGYILQFLGHSIQGNEVGEVTLIKFTFKKILSKVDNGTN